MARTVHYGRKLKRFIEANGIKKTVLVTRLKTSRVTLDKRLTDGAFVGRQLKIVKQILEEN